MKFHVKFGSFCSYILLCLIFVMPMPVAQAENDKLIVGIEGAFPPYTYKENGRLLGLHLEITKEILNRAELEYVVQSFSWKKLVLGIDRGTIDIGLPFRSKPERFIKYNMVGPFTDTGSRIFLFARDDSAITWSRLDELEGLHIGIIDGYSYPSSIEGAVYLDLYRYNGTTSNLILLLRMGRVDLVVSDEAVFWHSVEQAEIQPRFKSIGKPLESVKRYIAIHKSNTELAEKIQEALEGFKKTQKYEFLLYKYGLAD